MVLPAFHDDEVGSASRISSSGAEHRKSYPTSSDQRLALQYSVSKLLLQSDEVEEVGPEVLRAICEAFDWDLGQWWQVIDTDSLQLRAIWHSDYPGLAAYAEETRGLKYSRLDCDLWRALDYGMPFFLNDVSGLLELYGGGKLPAALRKAMVIPLPSRSGILCMLTTSPDNVRPPESELLEAVDSIARQFSQYLRRVLAEQALRSSRETATLVDSSLAKEVADLLRRFQQSPARSGALRTTAIGSVLVDESIHGLRGPGGDVVLTRLEWLLLCYFLDNKDRVLPREEVLEGVWGPGYRAESSLLHDTVSRLRQRLKAAGVDFDPIQTVHGVGYKLALHSP